LSVEAADEIFTGDLALHFLERKQQGADSKTCAIRNGNYAGWHDRETVMKRMRSRFSEEDGNISRDLLSSFAVIPRRDGGWIQNRTFRWDDGSDRCEAAGSGYDIVDAKEKLGPQFGWPYDSDVEIRVHRRQDGKVCDIWLNGEVPSGNLVVRVGYFYEFDMNGFVQLRTKDPNDVRRRYAYIDGAPYEYVREQDYYRAGGAEIEYWHRDAVREWPERFDFTPKQEEFAAYSCAAQALLKQFGSRPATR
jgi:hypothetical protein